ncbi:MAG TPA: 4-(cytidine 5'-diphospho)-2-C-methyl-D-erythritol kinase, partial [Bacteroidia bacterium]|nr:4-(cytidine 5'-diphospho)-2-C-methyl-D-erythritol kinase [Bacteroidia bacterium]
MISFPNCKINLGLHVLSRREDGFHELDTVFYPVPWTDILEIVRDEGNESDID